MKCALVIPAWEPEEIFPSSTAGSQINYWQPLGTLYVAASLRSAGHEVSFFNGAFLSAAEINNSISSLQPELVGIYSTAFGWAKAMAAAADIRRACPRTCIVAGGPFPIAAKEKCLADAGDVDAVVTGEGEETLVETAARIASGRDLEGVAGLVYRSSRGVVSNPPRPLITDLDALPFPARDLIDDAEKYIPPPATYRRRPVAVIITSRGCSRRCIFCFQIDRNRELGVRFRSVENVMDEIRLCLSQGYREIKFIDDTLAADYDRAMELARRIKAEKLDFTWFASACVSQVDRPLLEAFREAGCWAVLFGAESGVQKNLNTIRKGITLEQTRQAVKAAREAGLTVSTPFIFGIPGETYEEALQTIEFACELSPDIANFHALTPFPGTELYDNLEKYGSVSEDLCDYTYQGAAFVPHSMTREQIVELRQKAFRRFYSRPRYLARRLFKLRNGQDLKAAFHGVRSLFALWTENNLWGKRPAFKTQPVPKDPRP